MLTILVQTSIRHAGLIIALAFVLLGYGSYQLSRTGLDIFPEFAPKQVIIQTEAPGLTAEQVEILVTQAIETAINGLIGIKTIRSESIQGLSIVTAIFQDDTEIYRNRQLISERLASLSTQLPEGIGTPVPVPLSSSSATILTIGLSSNTQNLQALRSLVDWTLVPRLMAVPGVADINIFGGETKQLQIQIDPSQLRRFNLSIDEIIDAASKARNIPGSGFLENENQRFTIQVTGFPATAEALRKVVVKRELGSTITLGDISVIKFAAEPPIGAAQIMGQQGIVMMVIGQYGANTLTVSNAVEKALTEFNGLFSQQDIQFYSHLFRPADYIETSLTNLSGHLLLGGLFVLCVLYAFLFNIRTALISALAIPVSLLSAVIVLLESGTNLNIMVLGGLAIALGEVVDDAIIDTENIFRRIRENSQVDQPKPIQQIVFTASMEVRHSVVYASFIVAMVFIPLLTLSGVAGRLFAPLGYAYILAILMSLLVALTLTPALCYVFIGHQTLQENDPPLILRIKPLYRKLLLAVNRHFTATLIASSLACVFGFFTLFSFDTEFLPELREGHYIVHTSSIPGTSLQESIRMGSQLTEQFLKIPGIESVSQWAGRAERGADTYGSHYSEFEVRLESMSGNQQQKVLDYLRNILGNFPGILFEANTFLTERIDETISGYTSPVVVNIYGNDLTELDQKAKAIARIMQTLPGAVDVQLRSPPSTPLMQVKLNLDQLAFRGIQVAQVIKAIQVAYQGHKVGKIFQGNSFFNIAITLNPKLKNRPDHIGQLLIRTKDGTFVQLNEIASIAQVTGRYNILHQDAQRKQTVTGNIKDGDLDLFVQQLKSRITHEINFGNHMYPEYTGAAIEQAQAKSDLILHSLLAGTGVLLFIYIALGNFRLVLVTLANLPFSLLGGVAAVVITGSTISVGSMVGFVTLFGITVRNTIMLLSHYRYLVATEHRSWNLETAVLGAQERLPAILMTALVTALAMFPIAFNSDNPGREIMGPMASIIIGGLASSTALNLLLLPNLMLKFGRLGQENKVDVNVPH